MFTHGHSRIVGVGVYTPEKRVASSEILEYLDSENRFALPPIGSRRLWG